MNNLRRQLLHLKKTTNFREYFDLDNMTQQQLESTIKRIQEANGLATAPTNNNAAARGRGRSGAATESVSRPGDEWEVVAPSKKGGKALDAKDEKRVQTFTRADRNGWSNNILNGLFLYPDVLTVNEEKELLNFVNDQVAKGQAGRLAGNTFNKSNQMTAQLHYGVFYNMAENASGGKSVEAMPEELNRFVNRLITEGIMSKQKPDSAVVSVMEDGDGMLPHVESSLFARPIYCVTLMNDVDMMFGDKSGQIDANQGIAHMDGHTLIIPRRSVICLDDLVANDVQHAIGPSKSKRILITFRQQVCVCVCVLMMRECVCE